VNQAQITAVTRPNDGATHGNVVWTAQPPNAVANGHLIDVPRVHAGGPHLATASLHGTKSVDLYVVEIASLRCTNGVTADNVTWDFDAAPQGYASIEAVPNPDAAWFRNALPWVWNGGAAGRSHRRRRVRLDQVGSTDVRVDLFGQHRQITVRVNQVEAQLQLERVDFAGGHPVDCDTLGDFDGAWVRGRNAPAQPINQALDQYDAVLCYRRNRHVRLSAELTVTQAPFPAENVTIRGRATFNGTQLEWTQPNVVIAPNQRTVQIQNLDSDVALPNEVRAYPNVTITWEIVGAGGARPIGQTTHTFYATLRDPAGGAPNYWTLLDLTCRGANAAHAPVNTANRLVAALNTVLAGTTGTGNGYRRCRDGTRLSYWALGRNTPFVMTTADLLRDNSGTGRCNAWQSLFLDACRVHGITTAAAFNVSPRPAGFAMIVKNVTYNGAGTQRAPNQPPFLYTGNVDCVKANGVPGQGTDDPQFLFPNHAMVRYNNQIYDPSYGTGPFADLRAWDRASLDGIGMGIVQIQHNNQPLEISRECCSGFRTHRLAAGETLADVALAYNVVGGAAGLYNHPFNYVLRALRPGGVGTEQQDDLVYVPRDISNVKIVGRM
jgi:hypothetical protein